MSSRNLTEARNLKAEILSSKSKNNNLVTVNMDRNPKTMARQTSNSTASLPTSNADGESGGPLGGTEASVEIGETFSSAIPKSENGFASTVKDEGVVLKFE